MACQIVCLFQLNVREKLLIGRFAKYCYASMAIIQDQAWEERSVRLSQALLLQILVADVDYGVSKLV